MTAVPASLLCRRRPLLHAWLTQPVPHHSHMMQQRTARHTSDIRKQVAEFGHGLHAFSQRLEQDVAKLRRAAASKPHAGHAQMQQCLQDMMHRAAATGQDISALEGMTIDAISLEELVGHCMQLFQENQARISSLENYLQQYGYRPQHGLSIPANPLELNPLSGDTHITADTQLENLNGTNVAANEQAQLESQRQPFSQLTNTALLSPPVAISEALQTRYKSQTLSMDRVTPTPSPVLSSSTDMPYSPSMRELQEKYGAASFSSRSGSHRESIESVAMPATEQLPHLAAHHLSAGQFQVQTPNAYGLLTPLSQHQLPPSRLSAKTAVDSATAVAGHMAGCSGGQGVATTAPSMQLADSIEEETTMCLRDQLIHSRCTDQSTPEQLYAASPIGQPASLQRVTLAGTSLLHTPDHHQGPEQRPHTPDTANLLQRALASRGSAVLNSLTFSNRADQQQRVAAQSQSRAMPQQIAEQCQSRVGQLWSGPEQQPKADQQQPKADQQQPKADQQQQIDGHQSPTRQHLRAERQPRVGQDQGGTKQQLVEAGQQPQAKQETRSGQLEAACAAAQPRQAELRAISGQRAHADQQAVAQLAMKQLGIHQQLGTGQLSDIGVQQARATRQEKADTVLQSAGASSSLLHSKPSASSSGSSAHVTSEEYLSLGIMQRKHFTLEQIIAAVNFMQTLTHSGSSFDADDLSSLHLGDLRTKILLSSLTKLGKLCVQVDNGQITGYCMQMESV